MKKERLVFRRRKTRTCCPDRRQRFLAMTAACLLMTAGPALAPAQTAQVYSANAVGFTRMAVRRQCLYQLHCPFTAMNSSSAGTVASMMGGLPNGSTLIFWDSAAQSYVQAGEVKLLGAWVPGTNSLYGQSFWLYVGNSATQETFNIFLCGQVPDASTMPTSVVHLASDGNLNLAGFAYPCPIAWTNTAFAVNAGDGSAISVYDSVLNRFTTYTKTGADWSGSFTLQPGQGFWLRARDCDTWVETKPYDLP